MSVPASSERFLAKARELPADEVMLDLEDSVAPDAKEDARRLAITALNGGGWDGKLVAVRINAATTRWAHKDVIAVVEGAPDAVDSLILPKVSAPEAIIWLDVLLGQVEKAAGLPREGSASRRRSRMPPASPPSRRSPPPRRGSRRWYSDPPTSWPA